MNLQMLVSTGCLLYEMDWLLNRRR